MLKNKLNNTTTPELLKLLCTLRTKKYVIISNKKLDLLLDKVQNLTTERKAPIYF